MEAVILLQRCNKTNRILGNRTEKRGGDWYKTWAFPISERRAVTEGYDRGFVRGGLYTDGEYPGCPYCGSRSSVICGNCNKLSCWDGQAEMPCKWCGNHMTGIVTLSGEITMASGADV